jgi:hypothetical protein
MTKCLGMCHIISLQDLVFFIYQICILYIADTLFAQNLPFCSKSSSWETIPLKKAPCDQECWWRTVSRTTTRGRQDEPSTPPSRSSLTLVRYPPESKFWDGLHYAMRCKIISLLTNNWLSRFKSDITSFWTWTKKYLTGEKSRRGCRHPF